LGSEQLQIRPVLSAHRVGNAHAISDIVASSRLAATLPFWGDDHYLNPRPVQHLIGTALYSIELKGIQCRVDLRLAYYERGSARLLHKVFDLLDHWALA
jgi:hypothetical protein